MPFREAKHLKFLETLREISAGSLEKRIGCQSYRRPYYYAGRRARYDKTKKRLHRFPRFGSGGYSAQQQYLSKGNFKDIAYVTSKTGLLGLMRSWASYLGKYNIRVNAAVPGGMYNGQAQDFVKKNSALNMLDVWREKTNITALFSFYYPTRLPT